MSVHAHYTPIRHDTMIPLDHTPARNCYANIILIFSVASLIAAISILVGWLSYDEHYQILEFANYKRGLLDPKYLAWEFEAQIRAAIQPTVAFLFLNIFEAVVIRDPFIQAFLLRVISGVLFLFCSLKLFDALTVEFKTTFFKNIYLTLTFFLYIIPATSVRFSSENWSACFAMLAVGFFYPYIRKNEPVPITFKAAFYAGVLFGCSFLFRYQSALMITGLAFWLLLFRFSLLRYWLVMAAGFLTTGLLGILIDRWFYGNWTFTAWNYFNVNLLEGKAASFGVDPWWWYLKYMMDGRSMILLNGILLALVLFFRLRKLFHPITWLFFPFVFVHFFVSHKEMRFIYPILIFVPFMATESLQFGGRWIQNKKLMLAVLAPLIVINSFAFLASTLRVNDNTTQIFKYLRTLPHKPIRIYYSGDSFFFTLSNSVRALAPRFYRQKLIVNPTKKEPDFVQNLQPVKKLSPDTMTFVILDKDEQTKVGNKLRPVFCPLPKFIQQINYRDWIRLPLPDWKLYQMGNYRPNPRKSTSKKKYSFNTNRREAIACLCFTAQETRTSCKQKKTYAHEILTLW
jgi:phosphatidylinositol glycan class B